MQVVRPASALGTALGQGTRTIGRGAWKTLGALSMHPAFWMFDFMSPSDPIYPDLTQAEIETAKRLYALGVPEDEIDTLHYEGLLSDPTWIEASYGTTRYGNTIGRSGYEVPGAAEASKRSKLPIPIIPDGYNPNPRPMLTRPKPIIGGGGYVAQPATPTKTQTDTWKDTYREVFGEAYRPGLEPVRADVQAMPVAPPQAMTVKTGIFRNNALLGKNLPKNHPQYEAAQGHTFRIRPRHQILNDAATRTQNRLPAGVHASPVGLGDTSLIMSKRSLPVRSPLLRRM